MTGFLYDTNGQLLAKFDNTGKVISQHIHGSGLGGDVRSLVYKEALNSKNEVDTSYFFYNYRGDVIDVTTDDTKISYRYDAFGRIIGSSYPELGFSSKRFDESIGLSYFGARCYDAFIGRFISRDPIGYIDGANQYIYAANNPLRFIDPFGLCREKVEQNGQTFYITPEQKQFNQELMGNYPAQQELQQIGRQLFNVVSKNDPGSIGSFGSGSSVMMSVTPGPNGSVFPAPAVSFPVMPMSVSPVASMPMMNASSGSSQSKPGFIRRTWSWIKSLFSFKQKFPKDPNKFNPVGTIRKKFKGNKGIIIKWLDKETGEEKYEWHDDPKYGDHYHKNESNNNGHLPHPDTGDEHIKPGLPLF